MNSRTVSLSLSATLLAFLAGLLIWTAFSAGKAFSWLELGSRERAFLPAAESAVKLPQYRTVLDSLDQAITVPHRAGAVAAVMGQRLTVQDHTLPVYLTLYATPNYHDVRHTPLLAGRMPEDRNNEMEITLGYHFARRLSAEVSSLVGREVVIEDALRKQTARIVGVLGPSPAQDQNSDADRAILASLERGLRENARLWSRLPLQIMVTFDTAAQAQEAQGTLEAWAKRTYGPGTQVKDAITGDPSRTAFARETLPRITARKQLFVALSVGLLVATVLLHLVQLIPATLRRRPLLGIDRALGASAAQLQRQLLAEGLLPTLLGTALGITLLFVPPAVAGEIYLRAPPGRAVLAAALLGPLVLLLLNAWVARRLSRASAFSLLRERGQLPLRLISSLAFVALALMVTAALSTLNVVLQVGGEARALRDRYGPLYALQTGSPLIDDRAAQNFGGAGLVPVFSADDARRIAQLQGVSAAVPVQLIPRQEVETAGGEGLFLRGVATTPGYLRILGMSLTAGTADGCLLSEGAAQKQRLRLGESLTLIGPQQRLPCTVTGLYRDASALDRWLLTDRPELVMPPLAGLGLETGERLDPSKFTAMRVMYRATPEGKDRVTTLARDWPVKLENISLTPDAGTLLQLQSQQAFVFTLLGSLGLLLAVWGVISSFLNLLDLERYRVALDRALGMSAGWQLRQWMTVQAASLLSAALGALMVSRLLAPGLYNALALDVTGLPVTRDSLVWVVPCLLFSGAGLLLVVLLLIGAGQLRRQALFQILKEGV